MSQTFHFVCDDCKCHCWTGQARYIYKYEYIADFLHDHIGHRLRFLEANEVFEYEEDGYKEINEYTRT